MRPWGLPLLTDRDQIRQLLQRDPVWAAYALGDLSPELWPHTTWHRAQDELALVLRSYSVPILWASGTLEGLGAEVAAEPRYSVQVRPSALPELAQYYRTSNLKQMWRMTLDPREFRPALVGQMERLGATDVGALERLYADGAATGESPEFFFGSMVPDGVFFGAREGDELINVAGTHLVAVEEGVGAIGNVYTRQDRRGRGLAGQATSAIVTELLRLGVTVIALNVYPSNIAAIQVYERLGFRRHCEFVEGIIERL